MVRLWFYRRRVRARVAVAPVDVDVDRAGWGITQSRDRGAAGGMMVG
jgi:hypothetical protein